MANWETSATSTTFSAKEQIQNVTSGRQRAQDYSKIGMFEKAGEAINYGTTMAGAGTFIEKKSLLGIDWLAKDKVKQYSVVGIDGNQIGNMTGAIEEYVANVQTYLEKAITASEEQISTAFRGGDAEAAVPAGSQVQNI